MALTFPLSRLVFWDILPISEIWMDPTEGLQFSRTAGGDLLTADIADRLWFGEVKLGPMTLAEAGPVETLLSVIRQADRPFYVTDPRRPFPAYDPTGALLTGYTPKIRVLNATQIGLKGLPPGYQIREGDYLSFQYGASPVRFALHRAVEAVTANGSGDASLIDITPPLQPGAAVDTDVILKSPYCKATLMPGTMKMGRGRRSTVDGTSFQFVQTFR